MRNGISSLKINQRDSCMKAFNKIIYALLALSLLPVLTAYFAYGSKLEILFFVVTLMFFIGLIYLMFAVSKVIARIVLFFGVGLFIIQLAHLYQLWFDNEGGDPRVSAVFTLQGIFIVIVLIQLMKDSKILSNKKDLKI